MQRLIGAVRLLRQYLEAKHAGLAFVAVGIPLSDGDLRTVNTFSRAGRSHRAMAYLAKVMERQYQDER